MDSEASPFQYVMIHASTPMRRLAVLVLSLAGAFAADLSPVEQTVAQAVDGNTAEANALLERLVNINSGTLNPAGVRKVADVLRPEFEALGFQVRWIPMDEVRRAG